MPSTVKCYDNVINKSSRREWVREGVAKVSTCQKILQSPPRTFLEVSFLICTVKENNYSPLVTPGKTQVKQKSGSDSLCFLQLKEKMNCKAFHGFSDVYMS